MVQTVSRSEVERRIGEVIGSISRTKEAVVVEDEGQPVAVVISPDDFRWLIKAQRRETIRRLQAQNADLDPDEVLRKVTEIVEEVRRERHERERGTPASGR